MRSRPLILVAFSALLLSSCAVGPNYHRPTLTTPDQFYVEKATSEAQSLADLPWWQLFDDPLLNDLIKQALQNGFDARTAAWRVEEARARYGIAQSAYFPQVDYAGGGSRQRAAVIPGAPSQVLNVVTANVAFAWELDLWGRIRRLNESAKAQFLATDEARRGVLLSLVSDVATAYFQLRELDNELLIAQNNRDAFQSTYDLFNRRLEEGAASGLETSRAQGALGSVAAAIPETERAILAKENQINFLLGRNPQPIPRTSPLPALPPATPPGLPSQLLERRPDVRQAEQLLISANASVGVAKADFFPTLSLTGSYGGVSNDLSSLLTAGKTWSIGAGLMGPLFHGGAILRSYQVSKAQWEESKIQYEETVTTAFGDVSTALTDRLKLVETVKQKAVSVDAYREAVRFANVRYLAGKSSYYEVLEAQLDLFPAENALAQSQRDQFLAVVNLYRALGGGWMVEAAKASSAPP
ncbi:MAG TPA: efflux transporter outer membrane subunit [Steroidobacteraceae bacterium]|jgi:multidrug efflux system outer membrane protein